MEQCLTANDNNVDAVVASNDGTAGGVVAALASQGLAGNIPVSGQDGDIAALNRIAKGYQTVSAWKNACDLGPRRSSRRTRLPGPWRSWSIGSDSPSPGGGGRGQSEPSKADRPDAACRRRHIGGRPCRARGNSAPDCPHAAIAARRLLVPFAAVQAPQAEPSEPRHASLTQPFGPSVHLRLAIEPCPSHAPASHGLRCVAARVCGSTATRILPSAPRPHSHAMPRSSSATRSCLVAVARVGRHLGLDPEAVLTSSATAIRLVAGLRDLVATMICASSTAVVALPEPRSGSGSRGR